MLQLGLGVGTGNGYFIAFFSPWLKVTNTFVLPWLARTPVGVPNPLGQSMAILDNPPLSGGPEAQCTTLTHEMRYHYTKML